VPEKAAQALGNRATIRSGRERQAFGLRPMQDLTWLRPAPGGREPRRMITAENLEARCRVWSSPIVERVLLISQPSAARDDRDRRRGFRQGRETADFRPARSTHAQVRRFATSTW